MSWVLAVPPSRWREMNEFAERRSKITEKLYYSTVCHVKSILYCESKRGIWLSEVWVSYFDPHQTQAVSELFTAKWHLDQNSYCNSSNYGGNKVKNSAVLKQPLQWAVVDCNTAHVVHRLKCLCGCFYIGHSRRRDTLAEHHYAICSGTPADPMAGHYLKSRHQQLLTSKRRAWLLLVCITYSFFLAVVPTVDRVFSMM